ncbi:hypothetical protein MKEN_01118200 [Mycena kentingensis (nom. inval.)]|nr:hypothetical protein MKEN_01118200 [Mycena kentingensis (nom. inval.)]
MYTKLSSTPVQHRIALPKLPSAISAAEIVTAAAEAAPFPYLKAACGVVVLVLKTIETMKKNRADLEDLYASAFKVQTILLEAHADGDALSSSSRTSKIEQLCEKLQVHQTMERVLRELEQLAQKLLSHQLLKRALALITAKAISDKIKDMKEQVAETLKEFNAIVDIDTNREVKEIRRILTAGVIPALILPKPQKLGAASQRLNVLYATATGLVNTAGDTDLSTLIALSNLAMEYTVVGEYYHAQPIQEHIFRAYRARADRGANHRETLTAMGNLAVTYLETGQLVAAEELGRDLVDRRWRVQGDADPATLRSEANLAVVLRRMGDDERNEEARVLQKHVYEVRREKLGEGHADTLSAATNLAATYRKLGMARAAKDILERVVQQEPHRVNALESLALAYSALNEHVAARELKERILAAVRDSKGSEHSDTLRAMTNLAVTYKDLDLPLKAADLERKILAARTRELGADHPDTLECMSHLADSYYQLRQFAETEKIEVVLLDSYAGRYGDADRRTQRVMKNLEKTYRSLQKKDKAEEIRKRLKRTETY